MTKSEAVNRMTNADMREKKWTTMIMKKSIYNDVK